MWATKNYLGGRQFDTPALHVLHLFYFVVSSITYFTAIFALHSLKLAVLFKPLYSLLASYYRWRISHVARNIPFLTLFLLKKNY
jgi:hypothetical protein